MNDSKLWAVFSEFIRLRDMDEEGFIVCCTCPNKIKAFGTNKVNAGHFISRKHNSTKYDEKNVHAQCVSCNKYGYGKQFEYSKFLDKKYGAGTSDELLLKSKMFSRALNRYEIEEKTKYYKQKVKELKNGNSPK